MINTSVRCPVDRRSLLLLAELIGLVGLPHVRAADPTPLWSVEKEKWGYGTPPKTFAIDAEYDLARPFSTTDHLAVVAKGKKYQYLKPDGTAAFGGVEYEYAGPFIQGVARVRKGGKFGLIDATGKVAVAPAFVMLGDPREGLVRASKDGRNYGFIDLTGKVIIEPKYPAVGDFAGGYAYFKNGEKYGYLNEKGKVVIRPQFDIAADFSAGVAVVGNAGKFGGINSGGEFVVRAEYDHLFSTGLDPKGEKWFGGAKAGKRNVLIDRKGDESVVFDVQAGPNVFRIGDRTAVVALVGDKPIMKLLVDTGWAEVKVQSVPPEGRVYKVPQYDFDGVRGEDGYDQFRQLLTPKYLESSGQTEVIVQLQKYEPWVIIVAPKDGPESKAEWRSCTPPRTRS